MSNKKANKIILNGEVLIDLSEDTVTQAKVEKGIAFHGSNGEEYEGTYEVPTETKSTTPTKESQTIEPSTGKYLSSVTVAAIPAAYIIPDGDKTVTKNGTYDITSKKSVVVAIPVWDSSSLTIDTLDI